MVLNAKINAFLSSQNYEFAIAIKEILLKFCVRNFSDLLLLYFITVDLVL